MPSQRSDVSHMHITNFFRSFVGWLVLLNLLLGFDTHSASAAATAEQKEHATVVRQTIQQAGKLYQQKKYRRSARLIRKAYRELNAFPDPDSPDAKRLMQPFIKSLDRARALLAKHGLDLPPWKPKNNPSTNSPIVSFVSDIAPLLVSKCGRCHIQKSSGDFSMANFSSLLKGPTNAGTVVVPGDSSSRLIEVIQTGDMPRGSGKVSPQELELLEKWILNGAKFDGPNPNTPLLRLAGSTVPAPTTTPQPTVVRATGDESISFAMDLAPILAEQCTGCHGTNNPRNNFSLATFSSFLRGGDSGSVVVPSQPDQSLLFGKLRGTASGMRMPAGGLPPLSPAQIELFERWIAEGTKFDGPDENLPISRLADVVFAKRSSPQELSTRRVELAESQWKLCSPGVVSHQVIGDRFLILGSPNEPILSNVESLSEKIWTRTLGYFKAKRNEAFKGRITVFVFEKRYDFSEFGKMVEEREIPFGQRTHWTFDGLNAYTALMIGHDDIEDLEHMLAAPLASMYVQSLGDVPRWFAEGSGLSFASSLALRNEQVRRWDSESTNVALGVENPEDFLNHRLPPESNRFASYGYVKFLRKKSRQYQRLLAEIRKGRTFDESFVAAYGDSTTTDAAAWLKQLRR